MKESGTKINSLLFLLAAKDRAKREREKKLEQRDQNLGYVECVVTYGQKKSLRVTAFFWERGERLLFNPFQLRN